MTQPMIAQIMAVVASLVLMLLYFFIGSDDPTRVHVLGGSEHGATAYSVKTDKNLRKTGEVPHNPHVRRIAAKLGAPKPTNFTFEWITPTPDPIKFINAPYEKIPEYAPPVKSRFYLDYTPKRGKEKAFQEVKDSVTAAIIKNALGILSKNDVKRAEKMINRFKYGMIDKVTDRELGSNKATPITSCKKQFESTSRKKLHWGQRKLMLSEIQLLNKCPKGEPIHLVYPGSAVGTHLLLLMDMFPDVVLYLWDPSKFNDILYRSDFRRRGLYYDDKPDPYEGRVFINAELDNQTYLKYHKAIVARKSSFTDIYEEDWGMFLPRSIKWTLNNVPQCVFVSDIRLFAEKQVMSFFDNNSMIEAHDPTIRWAISKANARQYKRDMDLQREWVENLSPKLALLKFKLPRAHDMVETKYDYLEGDIMFQAFGGTSSTETRLLIDSSRHKGIKQYDVVEYERRLGYFNAKMRPFDMSHVKLQDICMSPYPGTLGDIWRPLLGQTVIGMDAVIETKIMAEYDPHHIQQNIHRLTKFLGGSFRSKLNTSSAMKVPICQLKDKKFR